MDRIRWLWESNKLKALLKLHVFAAAFIVLTTLCSARETTCAGSISPNGKLEVVFVEGDSQVDIEYKLTVRDRSTSKTVFSCDFGGYVEFGAIAYARYGFENYHAYWAPDSGAVAIYSHSTRHSMDTTIINISGKPGKIELPDFSLQLPALPCRGPGAYQARPSKWRSATELDLSLMAGNTSLSRATVGHVTIRIVRSKTHDPTFKALDVGPLSWKPAFEDVDKELNHNYQTLMKKLEPAKAESLLAEQRLWLERRDKECGKMQSTNSNEWYNKAAHLTLERMYELQDRVDNLERASHR